MSDAKHAVIDRTYGSYTLDALLALANAATEGPWFAQNIPYNELDDAMIGTRSVLNEYGKPTFIAQTTYDATPESAQHNVDADTAFIAAAREAVPALIERIKELEAETKQRGQALADAANEIECAGPVAHRIRVLKQQFQDWADAYRAERDDFARRCMYRTTNPGWKNFESVLAAVKDELAREKERP